MDSDIKQHEARNEIDFKYEKLRAEMQVDMSERAANHQHDLDKDMAEFNFGLDCRRDRHQIEMIGLFTQQVGPQIAMMIASIINAVVAVPSAPEAPAPKPPKKARRKPYAKN
jgi:hypothetical protein